MTEMKCRSQSNSTQFVNVPVWREERRRIDAKKNWALAFVQFLIGKHTNAETFTSPNFNNKYAIVFNTTNCHPVIGAY